MRLVHTYIHTYIHIYIYRLYYDHTKANHGVWGAESAIHHKPHSVWGAESAIHHKPHSVHSLPGNTLREVPLICMAAMVQTYIHAYIHTYTLHAYKYLSLLGIHRTNSSVLHET